MYGNMIGRMKDMLIEKKDLGKAITLDKDGKFVTIEDLMRQNSPEVLMVGSDQGQALARSKVSAKSVSQLTDDEMKRLVKEFLKSFPANLAVHIGSETFTRNELREELEGGKSGKPTPIGSRLIRIVRRHYSLIEKAVEEKKIRLVQEDSVKLPNIDDYF